MAHLHEGSQHTDVHILLSSPWSKWHCVGNAIGQERIRDLEMMMMMLWNGILLAFVLWGIGSMEIDHTVPLMVIRAFMCRGIRALRQPPGLSQQDSLDMRDKWHLCEFWEMELGCGDLNVPWGPSEKLCWLCETCTLLSMTSLGSGPALTTHFAGLVLIHSL